MNEIQGKEVGDIRMRKGSFTNDGNANGLHLVALEDKKYASMMLNNWSTTIRNGYAKKRIVTS